MLSQKNRPQTGDTQNTYKDGDGGVDATASRDRDALPHPDDNARQEDFPEAAVCSPSPVASSIVSSVASDVPRFPGLILEATAFNRQQLVHAGAPQVALAGRSNVGKSSLINALAGRKALAKVSATPGKTRSINYYRLRDAEAFLVDLPGYGYAKCSHEERQKWGELLQFYFCNTPGLRSVAVLLDARLSPQKADKELMAYAAGLGLPTLAVFTKADKCGKKELAATLHAWEPLIGKESQVITSARSRTGLDALEQRLTRLLLA